MAINSRNCCSLSSAFAKRTIGKRKLPVYVVLLSVMAATGGLMFGYDIGISGGVTVMDDFLHQFFPSVLKQKNEKGFQDTRTNCTKFPTESSNHGSRKYCLFDSQILQFFTSSLYLAAMVSTFFAGIVSRRHGRKVTMLMAGIFYDIGVVLCTTSGILHRSTQNSLAMLICGRIMLGFGVGFGNQAVPLFLSELAPADARGTLNNLFQLNVTIGILMANIVNFLAEKIHPWGWRLSLGLAGVPALLFTVGSLLIEETPNSLTQRGLYGSAELVLRRIRGDGYDARGALQVMMAASNAPLANLNYPTITPNANLKSNPNSNSIPTINSNHNYNNNPNSRPSINTNLNPNINSPYIIDPSTSIGHHSPHDHHIATRTKCVLFGNGLLARSNRPPLTISIAVQFFQQFTGINVIMLYSPVLFEALGSKTHASLYSSMIIAGVNLVGTIVSMVLVDRVGRRALLLEASVQMFVALSLTGITLKGTGGCQSLAASQTILVPLLVCVFVIAFAWSWGPVAWLISTEIFPLASRSEGQSVSVFFNMLFTFLIAHTAVTMLCHMKLAIFFFFAGWSVVMGALTYLFLPETMNMEIDVMRDIWSYHWFWKRFITRPAEMEMNNINPHQHN